MIGYLILLLLFPLKTKLRKSDWDFNNLWKKKYFFGKHRQLSCKFRLLIKKLLKIFKVHICTEFTKYEKKLLKLGFKTHNINFNRNSLNLFSFNS